MNAIKNNLGLVLSGGGVRGIAHIGVIKALLEHNINPNIVSGSSAGAVVGALFCNGYNPEEMLEFFKKTPLFHLNKFAFSKPGFIDTDKFHRDFKKYLDHDDFDFLRKKLFVSAVNMCNGRLRIFEKGQLIKPLLASSAFPGLFSPVNIENELYSDGGILDNFPIAPIESTCELMIGSYTSPLGGIQPEELKYSVNVLERVIRINYSKRSLAKFQHCKLMIAPIKLVKYGLLDVGKIDEIHQIGYEGAYQEIAKCKDLSQFQT